MYINTVIFYGITTALVSTTLAQVYLKGIYEENPIKIDASCKLSPLSNNLGYPVTDMNSKALRCGTSNMTGPSVPYDVNAGSSIKLIYDAWQKSPITKKHIIGPCSFFLSKRSTNGDGEVWSLINQVATVGEKWCSTVIQKNAGIHELTIPANITAGEYYLRTEITDSTRTDPEDLLFISATLQFYVDCITLNIASSYTGDNPKNYISIPWDKKGASKPNKPIIDNGDIGDVYTIMADST